MPKKYQMSWEGSPAFRWVKMFKGKRYKVSCKELGMPKTKIESYQAANDWWSKTVAELTVRKYEPEQQEQLDLLRSKMSYAANNAPELLADLKATEKQIQESLPSDADLISDDHDTIQENLQIAEMMGIVVPEDTDPTIVQQFFGERQHWQERLKNQATTVKNKTVGYQLGDFIEENSRKKPQTFGEIQQYLDMTLDTPIWSRDTSIDTIDKDTVRRFITWLYAKDYEPSTHNKVLGFFRRFITWLDNHELIERVPKNLKLKEQRKKKVHKAVKKYENVKEVIESLPMPKKLWALLGCNCSMTQDDLGILRWDWIEEGKDRWTLTRRRAKLYDNPDAPTVIYELWQETVDALKEMETNTGLVFLTSKGTPMYVTTIVEDPKTGKKKKQKKDMFSTQWNRMKPKCPIPLGKFRSIGSTALKAKRINREDKAYYLANTAPDIADQHYGAEHDNPFYEVLRDIREELGFGK